jgi:benzoylformate decarboxylase
MADGFAQASGSAAFVNLHSAAGVGHALGSIFTAYRNRTPLVITAGQQSRDLLPLRPFLGATSASEFPRPYVKWSCEPARAADVPLAIAQAHYLAMQKPCGPTFVSIPADDWSESAEPIVPQPKSYDFAHDPQALRALVTALNAAQNPALVIGAGAARDRAYDSVLQLAERLQASVWSEPLASRSGFPETHPLFAGFLPAAPEAMAGILVSYDLIVVLGAPAFTLHVSGDLRSLHALRPIYQITDDPELAAAAMWVSSILGNVRFAVQSVLEHLAAKPPRLQTRRSRPRIAVVDPIPPELVLQTIAESRTRTSVVVEEAPSHRQSLQQYVPMDADAYYSMASGGLGFGLAAAVGISLADPSRQVICVVGDGSAMYSIQALWTAAQQGLPITFVVMNNSGYGALRAFSQFTKTSNAPGLDVTGLDFVAMAVAQGCGACRVQRASDLEPALSQAFAARGPMLIEVPVSQDFKPLFAPNR